MFRDLFPILNLSYILSLPVGNEGNKVFYYTLQFSYNFAKKILKL